MCKDYDCFQPSYEFQHRSSTVKDMMFSPTKTLVHLVGIEVEHSLYRILLPETQSIYVWRQSYFTLLKWQTKLPSFSRVMENISRHRNIADVEEQEEPDIEETQEKAYFTH